MQFTLKGSMWPSTMYKDRKFVISFAFQPRSILAALVYR
jgi:hypothetical protein